MDIGVTEDNVKCLYYYPDVNQFVDDNDFIILNPFRYVFPSQVNLFLEAKEDMMFPRRDIGGDCIVILHYWKDEDY